MIDNSKKGKTHSSQGLVKKDMSVVLAGVKTETPESDALDSDALKRRLTHAVASNNPSPRSARPKMVGVVESAVAENAK